MHAIVYLRSTNKHDESIEQQRFICQSLAAQLGATIVAEFEDVGHESNALERPGLSAILAYLTRTSTELVIASRGRHLAKRDQYLELVLRVGRLGATVITSDWHTYLFELLIITCT